VKHLLFKKADKEEVEKAVDTKLNKGDLDHIRSIQETMMK